ncbi:hypothetical protein [Enterovibrio calviensis]|uniref:hypothetical protein n=1 Tax=Enterovibrio calviensis TaxID=91359 RepID=UPI000485254E|nr:hypothetical protein [Enterovibrio calviensis]
MITPITINKERTGLTMYRGIERPTVYDWDSHKYATIKTNKGGVECLEVNVGGNVYELPLHQVIESGGVITVDEEKGL